MLHCNVVDNNPTEFSDDANLFNVAISRAKSKLCVVTNGNEMPQDSIISQLIGYSSHCQTTNYFEVGQSDKEGKKLLSPLLLYRPAALRHLLRETKSAARASTSSARALCHIACASSRLLKVSTPLSKAILESLTFSFACSTAIRAISKEASCSTSVL